MAAQRLSNLRPVYDQLLRADLLQQAWKLVSKGGPAPGVDGRTLGQFAARAQEELRDIEADLRARRYRFLPVRRTFVAKLTGGKRRLGIPAIRDRVVEQAIRLVLEPVLASRFAAGSFAYRSGRGVQQAIDRLLDERRQGNSWILESDVQDFFDTIDHAILFRQLKENAIPEELIGLIAASLQAGARLGTRWLASRRGVPQGSPLSPLLANSYLTPFDHAVTRAGHSLIRYADDLVLCCATRCEASRALADVRRELSALKLGVNPRKTRILDSRRESVDFLGFTIHPQSIEPTRDSVERFRQAIVQSIHDSRGARLKEQAAQLNPLVRSFGLYYRRCHAAGLFASLDHWILDRLWDSRPNCGRPNRQGLPELVRLSSYLHGPSRPWIRADSMEGRQGYDGWCLPRAKRAKIR